MCQLCQRLQLGGVCAAEHNGEHRNVCIQVFVDLPEIVRTAVGHAVRHQDDGRCIAGEIVCGQLTQALCRGCVNIRAAGDLFGLHPVIEPLQLGSVAAGGEHVPGDAGEGDQNIDFVFRGLKQI